MTLCYRLENVVRRYRPSRTRRTIEALCVPSLEVEWGEILTVIGPNGSGKSTLLETMAFLGRPDEGRITLDDRDVWAQRKSLDARRRCPMLLQRTLLLKSSVLKNVMYGMRIRGTGRVEARRKANEALQLVQLDQLAHRTHRELSGGERQRVALARLLVLQPEVLILDEPTAHVDQSNADQIEEIIRRLHTERGMTVIIASHDLRQAESLRSRVVALIDGQLFEGPVDNLLTGTLEPEDHGFVFHAEGDLLLRLTPETIARDAAAAEPSQTPVRIAIDAERVEVLPEPEELCGRIESTRQRGDRCRLTIRLKTGQRMCAAPLMTEYARLNLKLGQEVGLRLADQSVRILGARP